LSPAGRWGTLRIVSELNEVGLAPPRGRPLIDNTEAERELSELAGKEIRLSDAVVVSGAPKTCPACGASDPMWGYDPAQEHTEDEIHPLA
jgi:hypothetical protein